jgi:hypothetical protein
MDGGNFCSVICLTSQGHYNQRFKDKAIAPKKGLKSMTNTMCDIALFFLFLVFCAKMFGFQSSGYK